MRVGLIARASKVGLGHQTLEIFRHLQPSVTVVVDHKHPSEPWYGDAPVIHWEPRQPLPGAFELLATCDVVISAESFYDWTLPERLRDRGIATVLIVNPELWDGHWTSHVWNPTSWLMREGWTYVPHPCPIDRYPNLQPLIEPLRVVHPTSVAMLDRNGRDIARRMQRAGQWTMDYAGPLGVHVEDYWLRDPGYAASLIPRRYGGLCLPALEAFSAGTPVFMPNVAPNTDWPILPLPTIGGGVARMKGGTIPIHEIDPLGWQPVYLFLKDRDRIEQQRLTVREWAEANSWDALMPRWISELEKAANLPG